MLFESRGCRRGILEVLRSSAKNRRKAEEGNNRIPKQEERRFFVDFATGSSGCSYLRDRLAFSINYPGNAFELQLTPSIQAKSSPVKLPACR